MADLKEKFQNFSDAILHRGAYWEPARAHSFYALMASVGVPVLVGAVIGQLTFPDLLVWYNSLKKPFWCPPKFVFGPVWTILYVIEGLTAWMVWQHGGFATQRTTLILYAVQMLANFAWNPTFFKLRRPDWAFYDISALFVLAVWMTKRFHDVEPLAGVLQLPYLLWVAYAAALNYWLWTHNPDAVGKSDAAIKKRSR